MIYCLKERFTSLNQVFHKISLNDTCRYLKELLGTSEIKLWLGKVSRLFKFVKRQLRERPVIKSTKTAT
jgi:hypothetical protein